MNVSIILLNKKFCVLRNLWQNLPQSRKQREHTSKIANNNTINSNMLHIKDRWLHIFSTKQSGRHHPRFQRSLLCPLLSTWLWVWVGWTYKVTLVPRQFCDLLCVPIWFMIIPDSSIRAIWQSLPADISSSEVRETWRQIDGEFCLRSTA
jgi:hypothetical protein